MKVDFDFFKIKSTLAPQMGRIMISEPFLQGNFFNRSIVLLVDYSPKGAVGFILNKPFEAKISELLSILPGYEPEVFAGGPVGNDNLFYIHTLGNIISGSISVKDELFWGGNFDELKSAIVSGKAKPDQVKFFVGYSGWSAGQLDDEITENSWLVAEADIKQIMKSNQNFWLESVKNAGGHYEMWQNFPEDPNSN
jgi:putative transcriptional regulator